MKDHADPAERSSPLGNPISEQIVPRNRTLDGFALEPGCSKGVALQSLTAGTRLTVNTRNTRYQITVLDPVMRQVTVSGGPTLRQAIQGRLEGGTTGGSVLRLGWVGVGLRMELSTADRRITTSAVQSVTIERVPDRDPIVLAPANLSAISRRGF
jgi:hypothetical protein